MAFSPEVRKQVRERAHFSCCLCHDLYCEAHHILPEAKGGPNTFENAAPLCPSCHTRFGHDESMRLFVTQARDFWYRLCAQREKDVGTQAFVAISQSLSQQLSNVATKADVSAALQQAVAIIQEQLAPASISLEQARNAVAHVTASVLSSVSSLPLRTSGHISVGDIFQITGSAESKASSSATNAPQATTKKPVL
jgi:hypothetical protein